jgi:hypothetical protein
MADKVYKFLNPLGIQDSVTLYPLALRLDRLNGKNIMFNMLVQVESELLIPLQKILRNNYPEVHWNMRESGPPISEDEIRNSDALIQGVAF